MSKSSPHLALQFRSASEWRRKTRTVVHSFYYEGSETTIYRCEPDEIEVVLSVGCGV